MKRHLSYLKYVLRHKWFVFWAGSNTDAPVWRLLIHDWTKFLPSEWFAYAETFYDAEGKKRYKTSEEFDRAWNYHQKRNKHHWEYWTLKEGVKCVEMPEKYVREMVADWAGAGRAITGKWDVQEWYDNNYSKIHLHPNTRRFVHILLRKFSDW